MGRRDPGRLGRLFGRNDETVDEDDAVALSGSDDHGWWADRRSLTGAPKAAYRPDPTPEPETGAADPWSAEALFADYGFDPTTAPPPPPEDDGVTCAPAATGLDEARLVLGVTSGDNWQAVSQAHRTLALQFHPDRLGDLSPEAQELGQQRMAEINRAYQTLEARRPSTGEASLWSR